MPSGSPSALRTPLDEILGTQANVQILRVLTRNETSMGRAETARRAGMTPQGGRKALDRLFDVGMVRYVGTGRTQQVRLRDEHPLAPALADLFAAEEERYRGLIQDIEGTVKQLSVPPKAVWIQGPVAEGGDEYGDPLILGLLANTDEVDELAEELRDTLVEFESAYDVTIEIRAYTGADLIALGPEEAETITVFGPEPSAFVSSETEPRNVSLQRHEDHDERAEKRARRLADLLAADPGLRDRALKWVEETLDQGESSRDLREWRRFLRSASVPRIRRLLTSDSERAVRLRQSLPFWPVLNEEERQTVLAGTDDES